MTVSPQIAVAIQSTALIMSMYILLTRQWAARGNEIKTEALAQLEEQQWGRNQLGRHVYS